MRIPFVRMTCLPIGLLALVWMFLPEQASAQKLTRDERNIIELVEGQREDAIRFLERTVNVNSGTLNPGGVKQVGSLSGKNSTSWDSKPDGSTSSRQTGPDTSLRYGRATAASACC